MVNRPLQRNVPGVRTRVDFAPGGRSPCRLPQRKEPSGDVHGSHASSQLDGGPEAGSTREAQQHDILVPEKSAAGEGEATEGDSPDDVANSKAGEALILDGAGTAGDSSTASQPRVAMPGDDLHEGEADAGGGRCAVAESRGDGPAERALHKDDAQRDEHYSRSCQKYKFCNPGKSIFCAGSVSRMRVNWHSAAWMPANSGANTAGCE